MLLLYTVSPASRTDTSLGTSDGTLHIDLDSYNEEMIDDR